MHTANPLEQRSARGLCGVLSGSLAVTGLTAARLGRLRDTDTPPRPVPPRSRGWPIRRVAAAAFTAAFLWVSLVGCGAGNALSGATKLADLADHRVTESSGLATSLLHPDPLTGVLWTHNDSGNPPYVFATDRTGRALACLEVAGATNVDWEDIAEGPGVAGPSLYIGDFGDNNRVRTDLAIYRVPEPDVGAAPAFPAVGQTTPADRIPFAYPGGAHYDAETLLVNPVAGEAFVMTKESSGASRVFQFPSPLQTLQAGVPVTLTQVATVQFSGLLSIERTATGGDISPDGTRLVIRTYTEAREWPINPGQSVADALSSNRSRSYALPLGQGESICYRSDGQALLLTEEGVPCPLYELSVR